MSSLQDRPISDEIRTQAAAWIALRYGPRHMPADNRVFQGWLNESAVHRHAFALAEEAILEIRDANWTDVESDIAERDAADAARANGWVGGDAPVAAVGGSGRRHRVELPGAQGWQMRAVVAMALVAVFGLVLTSVLRRPAPASAPVAVTTPATTYATGAGERSRIVLADGSQLLLNAATEIEVSFDIHTRHVSLREGEAKLQVAKNVNRPFIVVSGELPVRAVGTEFLVQRRAGNEVAVTLIEGSVVAGRETMKQVGERFTFQDAQSPPQVDTPDLRQLMDWRSPTMHFERVRLADAVSGMNIRIADAEVAKRLISGTYKVDDPELFATTIARQFNLHVKHSGSMILIDRTPQ